MDTVPCPGRAPGPWGCGAGSRRLCPWGDSWGCGHAGDWGSHSGLWHVRGEHTVQVLSAQQQGSRSGAEGLGLQPQGRAAWKILVGGGGGVSICCALPKGRLTVVPHSHGPSTAPRNWVRLQEGLT